MKSGTNTIVLDIGECGACHLCETVCSLGRESQCNPAASRIRVLRGEMMETLLVCQQCEVLFCGSVCPTQAIRRDTQTGVILVDEQSCTGCKACVKACPHQAVGFHPERKKALICDQCGGSPLCVEWCPRQALQYVELTPSSQEMKRRGAEAAFSLLKKIGT
jgi:carbon-monoxide dehydrogenase iron sulfur subunit